MASRGEDSKRLSMRGRERVSSKPASPPATTLLENGIVITVDDDRRRFDPGHLLIRDGAIAAVGPAAELQVPADAVRIDVAGCIVVPGLVNCHQHHWYNLFKGLGGGMLLEQWIQNLLMPTAAAIRPRDMEAAARLAGLEMLATGTTTFLNHSVTSSDLEVVEAAVRPLLESGMRQLFAKEIRPSSIDSQLALAEEVHRSWDGAGDGRVSIGLVIESTAHWVAMGNSSEELLIRGAELAARLDAQISDHVAGGTMSRDFGYLRFMLETGRTDIEFLHQLGVLDERWILAHAINAFDRDIELIAGSGANVVHTPTSESVRGGGIGPVKRLREAGVRVALGSDGPMVDTSVDMVEQMKAAILLQNQAHRDPLALEPEDSLAMATREAAAALGLSDQVGSLKPGLRADVAVFDLGDPGCGVWHDPVAALVQSGPPLRHLFVDGVQLIGDGAFTRHDADEIGAILTEARTRADELMKRAEIKAVGASSNARSRLEAIV